MATGPTMTESNGPLQISILMLALLVPGYLTAFSISTKIADDPGAIHFVDFRELRTIFMVTSPIPKIINGDPKKGNVVTFTSDIPNKCAIPMTVIGRDKAGNVVKYTGTLTVEKINPSALKNSVGIVGDESKMKSFLSGLQQQYNVDIVSQKPSTTSPGSTEMSIAISHKPPKSGFLSPSEVEDLLSTGTAPGFSLVTADCGSSCFDFCTSTVASNGSKIITKATVISPNDKSFAYPETFLKNECHSPNLGVCKKDSCANGGSCARDRDASARICACQQKTNIYGPLCQLLKRSYTGSVETNHKVRNDGGSPRNTMSFSFEHAGTCKLTTGLCSIAILKSKNRDLVTVKIGTVANTIHSSASLPKDLMGLDANSMVLYSDLAVQNNQWLEVSVHLKSEGSTITATTVFCTKGLEPRCFERNMTKTSSMFRPGEALVHLGSNFHGCIGNVRFNEQLVDLHLASPPSGTKDGCDLQSASCSGKCDNLDSVCYGKIGAASFYSCSCHCKSSKRKTLETITKPLQCSIPCSAQTPVINSEGLSTLSWGGNSGAQIKLNPDQSVTISFQLFTMQADIVKLCELNADNFALKIKAVSGRLFACIDSDCHPFPNVLVNDKMWHSLYVMIAYSQLTVRIDDFDRVHRIAIRQPTTKAVVVMEMPNSCMRGVRLSGIYLPASTSEKTEDKDSQQSIHLSTTGSVDSRTSCTAVN